MKMNIEDGKLVIPVGPEYFQFDLPRHVDNNLKH